MICFIWLKQSVTQRAPQWWKAWAMVSDLLLLSHMLPDSGLLQQMVNLLPWLCTGRTAWLRYMLVRASQSSDSRGENFLPRKSKFPREGLKLVVVDVVKWLVTLVGQAWISCLPYRFGRPLKQQGEKDGSFLSNEIRCWTRECWRKTYHRQNGLATITDPFSFCTVSEHGGNLNNCKGNSACWQKEMKSWEKEDEWAVTNTFLDHAWQLQVSSLWKGDPHKLFPPGSKPQQIRIATQWHLKNYRSQCTRLWTVCLSCI